MLKIVAFALIAALAMVLTDQMMRKEQGESTNTSGVRIIKGNEDLEDFYRMDHEEGGTAVIFNHRRFQNTPGGSQLLERRGTEMDVKRLRASLERLGHDVKVYNDLTKEQMDAVLISLSQADHTKRSSIVVAVLTHGDENVLCAFDRCYKESDLWMPFTEQQSPSLVGKPKAFIIQACRGSNEDKGVRSTRITGTPAMPDQNESRSKLLPANADIVIARATPAGFPAFRREDTGTVFIQALCSVLDRDGDKEDFISILTKVSRMVADENILQSGGLGTLELRKQVPAFSSTLRKKMKFNIKK